MPPRRSCFRACGGIWNGLRFGVSMPPRRSCFHAPHGPSPIRGRVSMPPRRSCFWIARRNAAILQLSFNATTAFLLPRGSTSPISPPASFQCHHGVPASRPCTRRPGGTAFVSMPPRRSCFIGSPRRFASRGRVSMPPRRSCFLGALELIRQGWGFVSMPPRRSCFRSHALSGRY